MTQHRLDSIDVFRGLTVAGMLLVNNAGDWSYVYPWLEHANWHGCQLADFIFPFFLVIVGVSLELTYTPKMNAGISTSSLLKSAWWRAVRIFVLGIVLHLIAMALIPDRHFRLFGVLQRIAICFGFAATLLLYCRSTRALAACTAMILIAYFFLLELNGGYEAHYNLADRLDTMLLGPLAYQFDVLSLRAQEPEGVLSTLPAIASVLLGVIAGRFLRSRQWQLMLLSAFGLAIIGFVWQWFMPWNKQLWTSSFVCWTSAWAFLLILLLTALIDHWKLPRIGISFGRNAIAAYALAWILTCLVAYSNLMSSFYPEYFADGIGRLTSLEFASFSFALFFTLVIGGVSWLLRRFKIYIKL